MAQKKRKWNRWQKRRNPSKKSKSKKEELDENTLESMLLVIERWGDKRRVKNSISVKKKWAWVNKKVIKREELAEERNRKEDDLTCRTEEGDYAGEISNYLMYSLSVPFLGRHSCSHLWFTKLFDLFCGFVSFRSYGLRIFCSRGCRCLPKHIRIVRAGAIIMTPNQRELNISSICL